MLLKSAMCSKDLAELLDTIAVIGYTGICSGCYPDIDKEDRKIMGKDFKKFAKSTDKELLLEEIKRINKEFPVSDYENLVHSEDVLGSFSIGIE